jgi:ABC-2 type transport system permease protein
MMNALLLPKLFLAELRREVRHWWSYRLNALSSLGLWLVAFPFMMLTFDSVAAGYGPDQRLASLIGFLVWELCSGVLVATTDSVTEEAQQGTLESVMLVPVTPLVIFSLRITAVFTRQAVETIILGLALVLILNLPFTWSGTALLVMGLTIVSVAGVGLALGGLAMIYKSIDSVVGVVTLLAVLFTGALVPLNNLGTVFVLLKYLMPMTWGIDALRAVLVSGVGWSALRLDGTLWGLSIQAFVFSLLGAVTFAWSIRRAQMQGSLGTY